MKVYVYSQNILRMKAKGKYPLWNEIMCLVKQNENAKEFLENGIYFYL